MKEEARSFQTIRSGRVAWRLAMESYDTSWFRGFKVFEERGLPKASSRKEILVVGCKEDTW